MSDKADTKARLRAIRKLCGPVPDRTAADRLARIEGIAAGKLTPEMGRVHTSADLMERLAAGQASRSPRAGDAAEAKAKAKAEQEAAEAAAEEDRKRAQLAGRNRKERAGQDRAEE